MRYKVIKISPFDGEWIVSTEYDTEDREEQETVPNAMGCYWSPETEPQEEAFDKLKACMIKRHKNAIEGLQKSLVELEKLELNNGK